LAAAQEGELRNRSIERGGGGVRQARGGRRRVRGTCFRTQRDITSTTGTAYSGHRIVVVVRNEPSLHHCVIIGPWWGCAVKLVMPVPSPTHERKLRNKFLQGVVNQTGHGLAMSAEPCYSHGTHVSASRTIMKLIRIAQPMTAVCCAPINLYLLCQTYTIIP
jgi:hypothetical protein